MSTRFGALFLVASALVTVLAAAAAAQQRPVAGVAGSHLGTIVGHVTERGKQAISYASVGIPALRRGTLTDEGGAFVLTGVPAGPVTLKVDAPSYGTQTASGTVIAGRTLTLDFTFLEQRITKTFEEYIVRGHKDVDTKSSTLKHSVDAQKIKDLPVGSLQELVGTRAGVVNQGGELHVHGGRAGEVATLVNGIAVTDALRNRGADVATLAIADFELISGGFDAEYGEALSGVVSVNTREGTDRLGGEVRWDTDRYGDATKTFNNLDRFTFGFGGPTPIKNLTYFATYEGTFQDTYLRSSLTKPRRTIFDFIQLGNRQSNQINTNFKLAYRLNSRHKLTLETINNRTINTPYNHMWSRQGFVQMTLDTIRTPGEPDRYSPRYGSWSGTRVDSTYQPVNMPDHVPTIDDRFNQISSVWTNQISDKTVWTTRASALRFETLSSVGRKQPWEYDIQAPFFWSGNTTVGSENNPYFATHGDYPTYSRRSSSTYLLKSDLSTRRWKQHTMKTGIETKYNRVQNLAMTTPNIETNGLPGGNRSEFINYNPEGAAYLQDRWEYEGLVLNAGLRYDVFTPGYQVSDLDLVSGHRYKQQFSPRLGIAYPISDKDVLSFHYGWTYQTPARNVVFENRGVGTNVGVRGNPDLEPETNIAYQAAMQHLFSRDVSGQFAVFFRDIFGLITTHQERDEFGNVVFAYANGDYASARGFEASLNKRFSHKFSAELNYTYSLATGVASDPNQSLQFFNGGRLYLPISERALDWDQRHTLSLSGVVRDPGKWGFRMLWSYGSGLPFTPAYRNNRRSSPELENSRRQPSNSSLTIAGDKYYKVWSQNVTLFFEAHNVLGATNLSDLTPDGVFPNPYVNSAGGLDYAIYYTETGRAGGAFLQDTNGDATLDWAPLHDPRVFAEGRNVRMGMSVTF